MATFRISFNFRDFKNEADRNFTCNILILTKRIEQGKYLYDRLVEEGEYVQSLLGKQQDFDHECRVLVGTVSKVSVGFDFARD